MPAYQCSGCPEGSASSLGHRHTCSHPGEGCSALDHTPGGSAHTQPAQPLREAAQQVSHLQPTSSPCPLTKGLGTTCPPPPDLVQTGQATQWAQVGEAGAQAGQWVGGSRALQEKQKASPRGAHWAISSHFCHGGTPTTAGQLVLGSTGPGTPRTPCPPSEVASRRGASVPHSTPVDTEPWSRFQSRWVPSLPKKPGEGSRGSRIHHGWTCQAPLCPESPPPPWEATYEQLVLLWLGVVWLQAGGRVAHGAGPGPGSGCQSGGQRQSSGSRARLGSAL